MFKKKDSVGFRPLIDGVKMRPLVWEEKTILCEFKLEKDYKIPPHHHPYEQTGYLISGKLNFRIGKTWYVTKAGDSWCIPENTEHEVEIWEDSIVLELFSPIRPDYLP
ncbi:MAG TPA: cupin domain-containing protein [Draconibacterium sp.]|jgi:quercetin dioxygenase-like cupin family protein|nr:cupin domain-containing protein [Draconibacterium sp.]